jgi:hypothetical protein
VLECSCTIESVEFLYCKNVNYISNLWWVLHISLLLLISAEKQLTCCPPILGDICNKYLLEVSTIGKDSFIEFTWQIQPAIFMVVVQFLFGKIFAQKVDLHTPQD